MTTCKFTDGRNSWKPWLFVLKPVCFFLFLHSWEDALTLTLGMNTRINRHHKRCMCIVIGPSLVDSSTYWNPNIWNLSSATLRLFMSLWKYLITLQQAERWNWLQHRQSASWDAQLDWNCSAGRVTGSLTACRPSSSLSHRLWRSIKPLKGETHNAVWRNSIQARRTQLFFNYVTAACLTARKLQWHDAAAADCKMQSHVGPWWRQEAAQKGRRKKKKGPWQQISSFLTEHQQRHQVSARGGCRTRVVMQALMWH